MKRFLLDIGNTHTVLAECLSGGGTGPLREFETENFTVQDLPQGEIAAVCVVPEMKRRLADREIFFADASNSCGAVDFTRIDCTTLGADRVATAEALAAFYPRPGIVIDCGTAVTMEMVDKNKIFRGGAIAPGRALMRRILNMATAQLPEIPLSQNIPEDVGKGTVLSIAFGVDSGCIGMVREFISVARKKHGAVTVVLTGGDAAFFRPAFPEAADPGADFTLRGLRIAAGW